VIIRKGLITSSADGQRGLLYFGTTHRRKVRQRSPPRQFLRHKHFISSHGQTSTNTPDSSLQRYRTNLFHEGCILVIFFIHHHHHHHHGLNSWPYLLGYKNRNCSTPLSDVPGHCRLSLFVDEIFWTRCTDIPFPKRSRYILRHPFCTEECHILGCNIVLFL
jgi:hypothetical protein